ncbi:MAG: hypothetical protein RLY20_559 [Verrucomicrobiota bacterium]|jgi:hypothetical protein
MNTKFPVFGFVPLLLLAFLAGCASHPKVNWATRIGTYTFDQAVVDYGPPARQARLTDGTVVAEWQLQRGYTTTEQVPYVGYRHRYYGYYTTPVASSTPDIFLRLTFDPAGKLAAWKKVYL